MFAFGRLIRQLLPFCPSSSELHHRSRPLYFSLYLRASKTAYAGTDDSAYILSLREKNQIMLSAKGFYRLSSSPFRWTSCRLSSSKLFVGGLSYDTNEPVLKDVFGQHGEIIEVKVICNHKSGKSKGYGFVHFSCEDSAAKALTEMDGQLLDGRNIRIEYANKK